MDYVGYAFLSLGVFALVHLFAAKAQNLDRVFHGMFLSASGGVAIAYVFVDLLPKLCKHDSLVTQALWETFPYLERHVYIMALAGFLLFFFVDRSPTLTQKKRAFVLSFSSYALFNFLVGYGIVDKNNPEVRPLTLFTIAISLHYFINDYTLNKEHGPQYTLFGKWLLVLSLFLGGLASYIFSLPQTAVALVSAFIGGGVIMNVIRHELPKDDLHSFGAFLLAAGGYTAILLALG